MTIEQAIQELKVEYLGDTDKIREAKDIAIKSLDMWDKVIEEIEEEYSEVTDDISQGKNRGLYRAVEIIEKYKKEI